MAGILAEVSEAKNDVTDGHARRLAEIDPLVRPVPPDEGSPPLRRWTRGPVRALATVTRQTDGAAPLWATRTAYALHLEIGIADPSAVRASLDEVVDEWLADIAGEATPGDPESAAYVSVASRDPLTQGTLVAHHFGPASVLAIRTLDRPDPEHWRRPADGLQVRPATVHDAAWLVERSAELHRHESRLGAVPERAQARASLAKELPEALARDEGWTWIASGPSGPIGFVQLNPPEAARWVTGATWLSPAGYLVGAYVDPAARSGGVGRTLAATAHDRAREEGWSAVLLHHSAASGWSAPFWASMGYRPLVTTWIRRPVMR